VSGYLIDTNVISEFVKPNPSAKTIRWLRETDPNTLFVSVVTIGEIRLGIESMTAGKRRTDLEAWVDVGLPDWFASNLLPITREIADQWGRLTVLARRSGSTLTTADGLLAATAAVHNLTLVTRNVKDFTGLGLTLFNPWDTPE
jgi:predicted nucleic acid-binding protein